MERLIPAAMFIADNSRVFLFCLAAVNLIAFIMYGVDKFKAKHKLWRIPEAWLIGAALLGGSLGALLGMSVFRHKTLHAKFVITIPTALVIHTVIITAVIFLSRCS